MPLLDHNADLALHRLFKVARTGTGQSRLTANFLLSWWNTSQNGGWDPTDLWAVDRVIMDDILTLIGYIAGYHESTSDYQSEFRALVDLWRTPKQPRSP